MLVFLSFILLVKGGIFSVFYKLFISCCRAVYCFRAVLGSQPEEEKVQRFPISCVTTSTTSPPSTSLPGGTSGAVDEPALTLVVTQSPQLTVGVTVAIVGLPWWLRW